MNREIKFRIWDIENKEMLKVQELDFEPTFYGGRIAIRPDQYNDYFDTEDMILMQYTGLHDKNRKEIYEGDIVLTQPLKDKPFSQKAKSKRLRGIVQYQVLCGKNFISEPDKIKYWGAEWNIEIIDKKDYEKYHNYDWGLFFECEVIGNIYDNPELLGGE